MSWNYRVLKTLSEDKKYTYFWVAVCYYRESEHLPHSWSSLGYNPIAGCSSLEDIVEAHSAIERAFDLPVILIDRNKAMREE